MLLCGLLGIQVYMLYQQLWAGTGSASSNPPVAAAPHPKTHYEVLGGLSIDATDKDIQDAFRQLSRLHHPDKAQTKGRDVKAASEWYQRIQDARDTLLSPQRCDYDLDLLKGGVRRYIDCKERFRAREAEEREAKLREDTDRRQVLFERKASGQKFQQQHEERREGGRPSRPVTDNGSDNGGGGVIPGRSWKGIKRRAVGSAKQVDEVLGHVPSKFVAYTSSHRVPLLLSSTAATIIGIMVFTSLVG